MKTSELRNLNIDERSRRIKDLRKELFNLRFQSSTGEIQNPMRIRTVKKEIAKILTINTEEIRTKIKKEVRDA
ncbi:Ribosomal protein L29 [Candidatus Magnetoovum chiemensis]|nr:Ribosomal protein L29 [Candidatus Magnetoovum chiemensis]